MTVAQVAGGALSLGYAMTIAGSQGLTATTALTYGHGADVYALYLGITPARVANHLRMPMVLLEEDVRIRLGRSARRSSCRAPSRRTRASCVRTGPTG